MSVEGIDKDEEDEFGGGRRRDVIHDVKIRANIRKGLMAHDNIRCLSDHEHARISYSSYEYV